MGFKGFLLKPFAKKIARDIDRWSADAVGAQQKVFNQLLDKGQHTRFGRDHNLKSGMSYDAFRGEVP
ncbi:MAG: hypothetical protein KI786_14960, partial [Mameliella sp.]|nr:hypothetical protein [Phaeodactylibacter sp.]